MSDRTASGARIKMLRERAGYSQTELGERSGLQQNSISNWELGYAYPQYQGIRALCMALSCSADELLGLPVRELTDAENEFLRKFRQLDEDGLHTLDAVLDSQLRRLGK